MSEFEPVPTAPLEPAFRIVGDPAPLFSALASAHQKFGPIARTKKVRVQPTQGAAYEFVYAPLENILEATSAALSEAGLTLIQPCYAANGGHEIRTILAHSSGTYLESIMFVSGTVRFYNKDTKQWDDRPLKIQELGSEITYKRRYSAQCVLGVNSEDDDDGNAADGNEVQSTQQKPPRSQPTPPAQKKPAEQRKPPQPDPQMQADIERRREENARNAAAESTAEQVVDKLEAGRAALAQAEAAMGVAPAVIEEKPASVPPPLDLPDSHVPDTVQLPKGSATREHMKGLLVKAGFVEANPMAEKVYAICGVDPRKTQLTYGDARAVIVSLESQAAE